MPSERVSGAPTNTTIINVNIRKGATVNPYLVAHDLTYCQ
jgi:hypothetical protein